jgi:hypothetical protein
MCFVLIAGNKYTFLYVMKYYYLCKDIVKYIYKHFFYDYVNPYNLLLSSIKHGDTHVSESLGRRFLDAYLVTVPNVLQWLCHPKWFDIVECEYFMGLNVLNALNISSPGKKIVLSKAHHGLFDFYGFGITCVTSQLITDINVALFEIKKRKIK